MRLPEVIGLCGPEGAGKSTVAQLLVRSYGYVRIPFAKPLKDMLAALGVPDECLWGRPEDKAAPLDLLCGKSARQAMQWLGTEYGRNLIGEDLWTRAWQAATVKAMRAGAVGVVSDDVRFANEVKAVAEFNGVVWCVIRSRKDFKRVPKHASEDFASLLRDSTLINNATVEGLGHKVLSHLVAHDNAARRRTRKAA